MNKSAVFCIIDGMSEEGFTSSSLPHLAAMAESGAQGFFDTVPPGFAVESYPCIASLLGITAQKLPPHARGYLEAAGAGLDIAEDDLVFRASWVSMTEEGLLLGPATAPSKPPPLPPGCAYHHLGGYKALLILRHSAPMLPRIETFAPHACLGRNLADILPGGDSRLTELVSLSQQGEHRVLLPWGQSTVCRLPAIGCRAAAVGATPVFVGLAQAMNFDFFSRPGFNGDIDTDLPGKARLTLELAREYPLVVLHINGADEAGHRRDAGQKLSFLRLVNDKVIKILLDAGLPLLVCADHGTSPPSGLHLGGPQPFVLTGTALKGDLGNLPANSALKLLLGEY